MRALAILLTVAAIGSMVVSLASHGQDAVSAWTMYTPLSNQADHDGIGPLGEIDQSLGVATPEIERAPTYDEYDGMPWDDARLWLGLAIGFAVSAEPATSIRFLKPNPPRFTSPTAVIQRTMRCFCA